MTDVKRRQIEDKIPIGAGCWKYEVRDYVLASDFERLTAELAEAKRALHTAMLTMADPEAAVLVAERDALQAQVARLTSELAEARAHLESMQNKWASRPLSHADGEALERENDALRAQIARHTAPTPAAQSEGGK